ncbi:MAG: hypothetical protein OXC54_05705, partial [Rhodospirillaceae bacterium]|nr:hypothetical protein [Rhodospirillaceae bacterium]
MLIQLYLAGIGLEPFMIYDVDISGRRSAGAGWVSQTSPARRAQGENTQDRSCPCRPDASAHNCAARLILKAGKLFIELVREYHLPRLEFLSDKLFENCSKISFLTNTADSRP